MVGALDSESVRPRANNWPYGSTVLALLFAQPNSPAIRGLDQHGGYFDVRTGETWDLFLPGYFKLPENKEAPPGCERIGRRFTDDWRFSVRDFNLLRRHVERASDGRWAYSGGTDLVLINAWTVPEGDPVVDWRSTISGQLSDDSAGTTPVTLGNAIERISRDLEDQIEDPFYGVGEVTNPPILESTFGREFMVTALGGIAAALGAKKLGA